MTKLFSLYFQDFLSIVTKHTLHKFPIRCLHFLQGSGNKAYYNNTLIDAHTTKHSEIRYLILYTFKSQAVIKDSNNLIKMRENCWSSIWLMTSHQAKKSAWSRLAFFPLWAHYNKIWGNYDWPVYLLTCLNKYSHRIPLVT